MSETHYLCDLFGASADIDSADLWCRLADEACCVAGMEVVDKIVHRFPGQGLTALFILSESHLAVHTWPERRFVAVELFSCRPLSNYQDVFVRICKAIGAIRGSLRVIPRGNPKGAESRDIVTIQLEGALGAATTI